MIFFNVIAHLHIIIRRNTYGVSFDIKYTKIFSTLAHLIFQYSPPLALVSSLIYYRNFFFFARLIGNKMRIVNTRIKSTNETLLSVD